MLSYEAKYNPVPRVSRIACCSQIACQMIPGGGVGRNKDMWTKESNLRQAVVQPPNSSILPELLSGPEQI
jgi:hypothetical protein